jgi:hypothetical protein
MTNYCRLLKHVINIDASKLEGSEHVTIRVGDDDCSLSKRTLAKLKVIVSNQALQVLTCLLLSFQQMMYRVNPIKTRETDLHGG